VPEQPENLRYHIGPGLEVGNAYPMLHARGFYEGMAGRGRAGDRAAVPVRLGGQPALRRAGVVRRHRLHLRGPAPADPGRAEHRPVRYPVWTTDIGGFKNGDINSPSFRELIVRWFQFGVFCPVFRLHGSPAGHPGGLGADRRGQRGVVVRRDEYEIIRHLLFLRERLRPYGWSR